MRIDELTLEDLDDIACMAHDRYFVVDKYVGDTRRWGHDVWVVFQDDHALDNRYYRFSYYEGSGDSEIDFEPTALEEVKMVEVVTKTWEPV